MSKLVTCIDSKNYNLTVGREYEVNPDPNNDRRYLLRNDRNIDSRYSVDLFEDVVVEPEEVINDTDAILASINVNPGSFSYERIQGDRVNVPCDSTFVQHDSHVSCGLRMISNISGLYLRINHLLRRDPDLTDEQINSIANRVYSQKLSSLLENLNYGGAIASTNTNDALFEQMNEVMETFDVSTSRMYNPNSGNQIIVYVFNLNADEVDEDE